MRVAVMGWPRSRHRVRRSVGAALLVAVALLVAAAAAWIPAAQAIPLRMRGGVIDTAVVAGNAVDSVLLDGVSITNGVAVVLDVAAMLPGALQIVLKDCVCDGGSQIYVLGHRGEPATDRSLEVSVSGLNGRFCSLVLAYNLPAHTNVTIHNSTIVTTGLVDYGRVDGLSDVAASPLVVYAATLSHSQLRVNNSVLRTSATGGVAMYVGGGVYLLSSAVLLHDVSLEASGGDGAHAVYVPPGSGLTVGERSVFSVTNASVVSSGSGFSLGDGLALSNSSMRFVDINARVAASPVVAAGGGTLGAGGWLDMHEMWVEGAASSVAALSSLALRGGVVSIARCVTNGTTLASGPAITGGLVSVQCNRAGGKMLRTSGDYINAGLSSVSLAPCGACVAEQSCFAALTASFSDCVCNCSADGVGAACLPLNVPLGGGDGVTECVSGVTLEESVTVGAKSAMACFDAVVFSGPIVVTVELQWMDPFVDALNVTLRNCLLENGAMLRIKSVEETLVGMLPPVLVNMTNVTSTEGTIVLRGALPPGSAVLLANSSLHATVDGSQYVPTSSGERGNKYGPAVVLDGVRLLSSQFVMTRTVLMCGGGSCTPILVEHGLGMNQSSSFYMDNCVVNSPVFVMNFLTSDLYVCGGSVFSVQNSSWVAPSTKSDSVAWWCDNVVVSGDSVLQFVLSTFHLGSKMLSMRTLTVEDGSWLVHRDCVFVVYQTLYVRITSGGVKFHGQSVWSILDNSFIAGASSSSAQITNTWNSPQVLSSTVYGRCNSAMGSLVTDYSEGLNLPVPVTRLDCDVCSQAAACFTARVSGLSGCDCTCAAGGHGDVCLPAAIPDGLGPLPGRGGTNDTGITCVHNTTMSTLGNPVPGASGLCFVDVTFTASITLDLSLWNPLQRAFNITLRSCELQGLKIIGGGEELDLNVASSIMEADGVQLSGSFGKNSRILFVDNFIQTTESSGVSFNSFSLQANVTVLFLRNNIQATRYPLYWGARLTLDGGGVIVHGGTLVADVGGSDTTAAVYVRSIALKRGGYFSVENTTMRGKNGFYMYDAGTSASSGMLRIAGCTFVGSPNFVGSALVFFRAKLNFNSGSQWRVVHNSVSTASIFTYNLISRFDVRGNNTTVVFSHNTQEGSATPFTGLTPKKVDKTAVAKFIAGCNLWNGEEVTYDGVLPNDATLFTCGTCNNDAACYMPATESVDSSLCSCSCGERGHGPSCIPFEAPDIAVLPPPEKLVDTDTTCVVGQTLASLTLNMWKTHHCYVNVTFSGAGAVATFSLVRMPLQYPINITFSGCTFRNGAALHFVGGDSSAMESAGLLIRISRTVMESSVVSFYRSFPPQSDIAIAEVDAEQSSVVVPPGLWSNHRSVVMLNDVELISSSFLISNINAWTRETDSSYAVYTNGTLTVSSGSSLYVRYCNITGYTHLFYVYRVTVEERSVVALLESRMASGTSILYQHYSVSVRNHSAFRVVGNTGSVQYAIYVYDEWSVQESSWLDWRDNGVPGGKMFYYSSWFSSVKVGGKMFYYSSWFSSVKVDGSSVVTLTGCEMLSTGLSGALVISTGSGYKFVAGCLKIAGQTVTSLEALGSHGITGVTTAAECGVCAKDSDCFAALTSDVDGCTCVCASAGYGDVCAPAPVPVGPPPPPPPPSPPPPPPPPELGECLSNVDYPQVTQTLGDGLSWLCYSNVTFSGSLMLLKVNIGAMTGNVNIMFDGCRWMNGAALLLISDAAGTLASLSVTITGSTFDGALLVVEGVFPPHTDIAISGNHFNVTGTLSPGGLFVGYPSSILMDSLEVKDHSSVVLNNNVFLAAPSGSRIIYGVGGALVVSQRSLFAVTENTFTLDGGTSTPLYLNGKYTSIHVLNSSAVVIRGNVVPMTVTNLFMIYWYLRVEFQSALVVRDNDVQVKTSLFRADFNAYLINDSWVQLDNNRFRGAPAASFYFTTLEIDNSAIVVRDTRVYGSGSSVVLRLPSSPTRVNESIVVACNTQNSMEVTQYGIPAPYNTTIMSCSAPCSPAASCFPALTEAASGENCTCTCAEGGHGDACLPVEVPSASGGSAKDVCVRDIRVEETVHAGLGEEVVCYVGVTFTADVVVDVSAMSGITRNVTLTDCTMADGASLYVLGWPSDPPAGQRVDVWISGLVSRSGGGVLLAGRYPPGSRVTVSDSTLVARTAIAYRSEYNLGASACLVLYNVSLVGSVLTVARTQVVALFHDARGVLVGGGGGIALASGGALYMDRLAVQTALGLCVSFEGGVSAVGGSVLAFVDSGFLLCKHAVSVSGALDVSGSAVAFVRNEFASTQSHAVAFGSTTNLANGSMLMMKDCAHDSNAGEVLRAAGAVSASGSTLSFVRNQVRFSRMLSVDVLLSADAHMRAACNSVGGSVLTTAEEYAAAGFGNASGIDVAGCAACEKDAYCYPPGTASAAVGEGGECVCVCGGGGHGDACLPVAAPALPPAGVAASTFLLEDATLHSEFIVPNGVSEVTLRRVVLDGVQATIYVPWMAGGGGARVVVQDVSLRGGAVLYLMGGAGMGSSQQVELSVCGVDALNGVIALTGTFAAESVLTITDSQLVTTASVPLAYLPGSQAASYAAALVFSNLRLVRSVLVVYNVALLVTMEGGRAVFADGAVLELLGGGIALDAVVIGGWAALYVGAQVTASDGAVLRVSESGVYARDGLVLDSGVAANASAVVVNDNTGALNGGGALLKLRGLASFVSGSWVSVRGNSISGTILSLPFYPNSAVLERSTLTLYGNAGSGSAVMDGLLATGGAGRRFVVGCLRHNGEVLLPIDYSHVGITAVTRSVGCNACDADVSCFAAATTSMSSCHCHCTKSGYGGDCLPVYLPRPDGCNRTPARPLPTPTPTLTGTITLTPTQTMTVTPPIPPTVTPPIPPTVTPPIPPTVTPPIPPTVTPPIPPTVTPPIPPTVAPPIMTPSLSPTVSPSVSETPGQRDVVCPPLAVSTTTGSSLTQDDIRNGGVVPTRLVVTLPPQFEWMGHPFVSRYLTFSLASAAQPAGFSGPWGAMLRNATWVHNLTNRRVLELVLPVYSGFFIGADETIFIRCDPLVVYGGCRGQLLGFFTIKSNTPAELTSALSVINGVVAGATVVAVVISGGLGSVLEIQTLGVFAKMSCASVQERASSVALPYFLSLFASLDFVWIVAGNALIAVVFGCVHYGLTLAFQRWRGVDALGAWAAMRFPSLTYLVAYLMHLGIFVCSVFMLAMPGAQAQHYVIGVAGVLYGVAFPFCVCYFVAHHTSVNFTKYWQFSKKPPHERWMYPVGYWCPAMQQQMYGSIFTNMKGSYVYWCVFQLSVLCLVGAIAAVQPPVDRCHIQYFCMAAVLLAGAGVVAFTNMMRSVFLTAMHTASFVLLSVLCLINAANYLSPNDGGVRAYVVIALLLMLVLLGITVYSAAIWYVEGCHWQTLRGQQRGTLDAMLNVDAQSGGDDGPCCGDDVSSYATTNSGVSSYRAPLQPHLLHSDSDSDGAMPNPPADVGRHMHHVADNASSDALSILDRVSNTAGGGGARRRENATTDVDHGLL